MEIQWLVYTLKYHTIVFAQFHANLNKFRTITPINLREKPHAMTAAKYYTRLIIICVCFYFCEQFKNVGTETDGCVGCRKLSTEKRRIRNRWISTKDKLGKCRVKLFIIQSSKLVLITLWSDIWYKVLIAAVGSSLILTWVTYVSCPDLFADLCIVNEIGWRFSTGVERGWVCDATAVSPKNVDEY